MMDSTAPVFVQAEFSVTLSALQRDRKTEDLIQALTVGVPARLRDNVGHLQRETLETYFAEVLRALVLAEAQPAQENARKVARDAVMSCVKAIAASKALLPSLVGEAADILVLVDPDTHSAEALRVAEQKVRTTGAKGLYKVFIALGRSFLALVKECLAESSVDQALLKKSKSWAT